MTSVPGGAPGVGFLAGDSRLARAAQPLVRFLHIEVAGALLLLVATATALVWANSPWQSGYESLWSTEIVVRVGRYTFAQDLGHLVNDLLMAVFFFVVGMEIKREMVVGELRDARAVTLPVAAAAGGVVAPAVIFAVVNAGGSGSSAWGVPIATDIAFALGVVALLGSRVPAAIKVLLLTLAIADDIAGIGVIAVFYSDSISLGWIAVAVGITAVVIALHRMSVVYVPVLVVAGAALWLAVYESGVHATIAGVIMGVLMPARPRLDEQDAERLVDALENRADLDVDEVRATANAVRASVSDCDRAIAVLHPWTGYVIVPLFALANAGIVLSGESLTSPSPIFVGVFVGLVVGKLVGVSGAAWLAVRCGLAQLPDGVRWVHIVGVAAVAGIGFTVALFIAGLSLSGEPLADAKAGVLAASLVASILGGSILWIAGTREPREHGAVQHHTH